MTVFHREHMVLGKHAVALFTYLAHALGVGGGQVDVRSFPPGQEAEVRAAGHQAAVGQQPVQRQAAQLLQKSQLAVQCSFQHRAEGAGSSRAHADGLGFQHGGAEVVAPVGGVVEQGGFKLGCSVAHRAAAGGTGLHPVGQIHQFCDHGVIQQAAKDHKPVEPGVPFSQFHIPVLYLLD